MASIKELYYDARPTKSQDCSVSSFLESSLLNFRRSSSYSENCWSVSEILSCVPDPASKLNPLNPELNPICYLLALLEVHFLHVGRIRVKSLTLRLLMSYIYIYIYIHTYGAPILDVSRSHTTTQHSR